ncbi:hypothetical protein [Devosia sp. 2618]|uniref:hypothetical protein n=1 Tax=Devosia sp. 2618 TaxID=3156454 RepID=UPI00339472F4
MICCLSISLMAGKLLFWLSKSEVCKSKSAPACANAGASRGATAHGGLVLEFGSAAVLLLTSAALIVQALNPGALAGLEGAGCMALSLIVPGHLPTSS